MKLSNSGMTVHRDCFLYVTLYLSIRSGNWSLRNYSLHQIYNFFQISDSKYYFRLLPHHLADILTFPDYIIDHFKNGAFVSNITGTNWSSIALDEMHEMTINKDIKVAFTTPTVSNVKLKLIYLPYRTMVHKSDMQQLNPGRYKLQQKEDSKQFNKDLESNIMVYTCISEFKKNSSLFQVINSNSDINEEPLRHLLNGTVANTVQHDDLLGFHELGKQYFEDYCKVFITKESTSFTGNTKPSKYKKINNFQGSVNRKSRTWKQVEKHQKDIISVKNLQIDWANIHNIAPGEIHNFVTCPAAIANHDLTPYKGTKSKAKVFLQKHYPECFSIGTINNNNITCVVVDAMFMLHSYTSSK